MTIDLFVIAVSVTAFCVESKENTRQKWKNIQNNWNDGSRTRAFTYLLIWWLLFWLKFNEDDDDDDDEDDVLLFAFTTAAVPFDVAVKTRNFVIGNEHSQTKWKQD